MTDLIKPMAEFSVEGPLKSISFDIGSYNVVISESIVVQWIVMLVLGIVFFILGRNLKVRSTSRRQMAAEYLVNFFNNMVRDTMGE
ncbi:MAG: ATP F0F1 synthase subunit A, partial [Ruminiclostridium sp.]|nr:ATP F0F1 synthase subunit A [Ruminiclostridium sp.]